MGNEKIGILKWKWKMEFCKNANGILRKAVWIGNMECWQNTYTYSKLVYGDFIEKHKWIGINWGTQRNKVGLASYII